MSELYISDIPALPDPDYVWVNPESQKDLFERFLDDSTLDISPGLRASIEAMAEDKRRELPKQYDYYVERFFDYSDAQSFINQYAVYGEDGVLSIDATSTKIGIPYNYNIETPSWVHGEIVGLPGHVESENRPLEIHLNADRQYQQLTFGHEIGHYFWRSVTSMGVEGYDRLEEDFCDYFGRRMALPDKQLRAYDPVDKAAILDIMSRFRAELGDTIIALMETGLLPDRIAIDSYNGQYPNLDYSEKVTRGVFCLHCMQVGGDYNCPKTIQATPLFDFTDRAWGGKMQSCLGEDVHKADILSMLTKYYVANEVQLVLFRPGAEL